MTETLIQKLNETLDLMVTTIKCFIIPQAQIKYNPETIYSQ